MSSPLEALSFLSFPSFFFFLLYHIRSSSSSISCFVQNQPTRKPRNKKLINITTTGFPLHWQPFGSCCSNVPFYRASHYRRKKSLLRAKGKKKDDDDLEWMRKKRGKKGGMNKSRDLNIHGEHKKKDAGIKLSGILPFIDPIHRKRFHIATRRKGKHTHNRRVSHF